MNSRRIHALIRLLAVVVASVVAGDAVMGRAAYGQAPRIDTFPAPAGKWTIDHHSKDNGWEKSYLVLRNLHTGEKKPFAKIESSIQGAPIWSGDSKVVIFNTGRSTYLIPKAFAISADGEIKELEALGDVEIQAEKLGKMPSMDDVDYWHSYLRCRYFDAATNAFWFTFAGDYDLKKGGPKAYSKFVVKLDYGSLKTSIEEKLPRPAEPAPPPRAAAFSFKGNGTGFLVNRRGHALTCFHVVEGAAYLKVDMAEGSFEAEVIAGDKELDVAVLKLSRTPKAEPLPLSFVEPELADEVFTIGFPNAEIQGFSPKYTRGEISSLTGLRDHPLKMQVSVPIQPGSSGGALVSETGVALGIVVSKLDTLSVFEKTGDVAQNVNYAVKTNRLGELVRKWGLIPTAPQPTQTLKEAVKRAQAATLRISVYGVPGEK